VVPPARTEILRVCVDSDALIAGLMSRKGASHAMLVLGEIGLFTLVVPRAAIDEVRRNLDRLLPAAVPLFEQFLAIPGLELCTPSTRDEVAAAELADAEDVPIFAAAISAGARFLATHNVRHFHSGLGVRVVKPAVLLEEARAWIAQIGR